MDAETKDLALQVVQRPTPAAAHYSQRWTLQLWDFHRVGHQLQRCDVMLVLGRCEYAMGRAAVCAFCLHQSRNPSLTQNALLQPRHPRRRVRC
jgi:hypothetical protein